MLHLFPFITLWVENPIRGRNKKKNLPEKLVFIQNTWRQTLLILFV